MCKTKKIIAGFLCAIVAGIGVIGINAQSVDAQTAANQGTIATAGMSLEQLQQIIDLLKQQIQQIIVLLQKRIAQSPVCGNGVCETAKGETAATCAKDCAIPACTNNLKEKECVLAGGFYSTGTGGCLIIDGRVGSCGVSPRCICEYCGNSKCEADETAANCFQDCATAVDKDQTITIKVSGEGYQTGDIVKIRLGIPQRGDVIYYDSSLNNDMCMAMGPGLRIVKVAGVSGDKVSFSANSARVGDTTITYDRDYYLNGRAVIGGVKYAKLAGGNITVPINEIFADSWIGFQCFPGEIEDGSSIPYNRFTVAQSAIIAILGEKVGHDDKLEKELKSIVY